MRKLARILHRKKIVIPLIFFLVLSTALFLRFKQPSFHQKSMLHSFDDLPKNVQNNLGETYDPVNVVIISSEEELRKAFAEVHWVEAEPISLISGAKLFWSGLTSSYYAAAPMGNLYLFGRGQDLAFQKPGSNVRRRDHIRIWRSDLVVGDGRDIWVGAATYDDNITLDKDSFFLPTHSISPDIDKERNTVATDLSASPEYDQAIDFQSRPKVLEGHFGGNTYFTDGSVKIILLR